jgi:hypothetical protein
MLRMACLFRVLDSGECNFIVIYYGAKSSVRGPYSLSNP